MSEPKLLAWDIKGFPGNGEESLVCHGDDDCPGILEEWEDRLLWDRFD